MVRLARLVSAAAALATAAAFAPLGRAAVRPPSRRSAVWSDDRATREYHALLESGENAIALTEDCSAVIVGKTCLGAMFNKVGRYEDVEIDASEPIPTEHPISGETNFPIFVCLPPQVMEAFLDGVSDPVHRDNLCFVNCGEGILETLLKRKGMSGTAVTTAVLYYEMTARNQRKPTDPYTVLRMGPQGDNIGAAISAAGGKWAGTIMQRFQEAEMYCEFGWQRDMKRHMYEKLVFECVFHLVGAVHGGGNMGDVVRFYEEEVLDMLRELNYTLRSGMAITLQAGYEERMFAYAERIGQDPCLVSNEMFAYRNAHFLTMSLRGLENGWDDPCPTHTEYLMFGKEKGMFTFDMPDTSFGSQRITKPKVSVPNHEDAGA